MPYKAEFIGGCMEGRRIVEDAREVYRAVRRRDTLKLDDRSEIHTYRKGARQFSPELSPEQRAQIIAARGELVYIFEGAAPPRTHEEE